VLALITRRRTRSSVEAGVVFHCSPSGVSSFSPVRKTATVEEKIAFAEPVKVRHTDTATRICGPPPRDFLPLPPTAAQFGGHLCDYHR
jgi:hypothetical protein